MQRKRIQSVKDNLGFVPRIHAMVFDPKTGLLNPLKVDYSRRVGSLEHIYGLYQKEIDLQ